MSKCRFCSENRLAVYKIYGVIISGYGRMIKKYWPDDRVNRATVKKKNKIMLILLKAVLQHMYMRTNFVIS